jgi:hypothetical protein
MRGHFEEAVKFGWSALAGMKNLTARDRILSDLAASFGELGMIHPARDALCIVAMTAQELYLRWIAEINLLEITSDMDDEPAFHMYRLGLVDVELPASLEANYHLHVGRGYYRLGKSDSARESLEKTKLVAAHHKFNQIVIEADKCLAEIERSAAPSAKARATVSPEVEDIAAAVHKLYLDTV